MRPEPLGALDPPVPGHTQFGPEAQRNSWGVGEDRKSRQLPRLIGDGQKTEAPW